MCTYEVCKEIVLPCVRNMNEVNEVSPTPSCEKCRTKYDVNIMMLVNDSTA